ncbi:MAG: hypothetical protein HXS44_11455 [Theionarchaea archaeon]|nr:hypothetical protein [Theionarchaea archaeon]
MALWNRHNNVSFVNGSGKVRYDIEGSQEASDHFPVYALLRNRSSASLVRWYDCANTST